MPPKVAKPPSPDRSSTKSRNGSVSALAVAQKTFGQEGRLPFDEHGSRDAATAGKSRLQGAFRVPIEFIHPDPTQPRKKLVDEDQEELAASIKEHGLLQPIRIRPRGDGHYILVTGHRRLDASRRSGLAEIDCLIRETLDDRILAQQIVENWQRVDLEPLELSDALAELRERGHSQRQIADMLGKPESEISRLLSLQKLEPSVRQQAQTDAASPLSRRHLVAIAARPGEEQIEIARNVIDRKLTAEETEKHVQTIRHKEPKRAHRGAMYSKLRFTTSKGTVSFVFRKPEIASDDILAALDEVRVQVANETVQR